MLDNACCCPKKCLIESDDFNRTDSADIGGKWTDSNSRITGNRLTQQALGASSAVTVKQHSTETMVVDVAMAFTSSSISVDLGQVAVNYLDSNNYLYVEVQVVSSTFSGSPIGTHLRFFRRSGGVSTQLGSTRTIDASNAIHNHQLRVCYDGTYLRALGHIEAATKIDGGFRAGLLTSASSAVFHDDFKWYRYIPNCPKCTTHLQCQVCAVLPPANLIVDYGAGGLTNSACSYCDTVSGEFILRGQTSGPAACSNLGGWVCHWKYERYPAECFIAGHIVCGHVCIDLFLAALFEAGGPGYRFQQEIQLCIPAFRAGSWYRAIYRSNFISGGDCGSGNFPMTLSKTTEQFNGGCGGALPATIELRDF